MLPAPLRIIREDVFVNRKRAHFNIENGYYVPPQCCDQFSTLYDADGAVICAPDGGITGRGDGKCPDFFQSRTNEKLFWEDSRTQ